MHIRPLPPSPTRDAREGTETFIEVFGFGSNPGNLRMLSYVPEGLPAGVPLVVVLHGCTQTAIGYGLGSGWLMLAEELGFALLLPEQRRANNRNGCFNWFKPDDIERDRGEAQSIVQMIDHMVADYDLDQSRIFATGLSAGGAMAAVMLATYPDVFAGGAILAGLPYKCAGTAIQALAFMRRARSLPAAEWGDLVRQASRHRGPWPRVSVWHGTRDRVVALESSLELVKQWTDVHEVAHMAPVEDVVDGHARWTYRNATGIAVVEALAIAELDHGIPVDPACGGRPADFLLEADIHSTHHIARFWGLAAVRPVVSAVPVAPTPGIVVTPLEPQPEPILVEEAVPDLEPILVEEAVPDLEPILVEEAVPDFPPAPGIVVTPLEPQPEPILVEAAVPDLPPCTAEPAAAALQPERCLPFLDRLRQRIGAWLNQIRCR
jgi:poly(hydroxyalkanoate) depolymerase family esterase